MVAGLAVPGLLAASKTIICDQPPLIATSPQAGAELGWSMAIGPKGLDPKGPWLAVGAHLADADNTRKDSGSVALYRNPQPGERPTISEIIPTDLQAGDQFGASVSISEDWLAVGAPVGDGRVRDSGVVYLFHRKGETWDQMAKLDATDAAKGDQFGFSVSLNENVLVVGAPGESARGSSAGAAYVFEVKENVWTQTAKILANDGQKDDGRPFDEFGSSLAIDGDEIVVGAPFADDLTVLKNFGAVYVFQRDPTVKDKWPLEKNGKLTASQKFHGDNIQFGAAVAIREGRIMVGAPGDDLQGTDSGSAYIFERMDTGWNSHQLQVQDPGQGEQLGASIQIDADRVLIGARFDGEGSRKAGAAYFFERQNDGNWTQTSKFIRHSAGGAFGQSAAILDDAILGDTVFMGGFLEDVGTEVDAGAVATCSIPIQGKPDLICAKSGPASVEAGELVTYTMTLTNQGTAAATGVTLDDPTPSRLTFVSADPPCDKGFPCSLGTIPASQSVSKKVTFQIPDGCAAPSSIENEATVTGGGLLKPLSCPTRPRRTTVLRPPPGPVLECKKQGPDSVEAGGVINYKITVSNIGCATANDVKLSDPTPPGLISMSEPCVQSSCNLGPIGPGQSLPPVMLSFKVQAPAACAPSPPITNTATVTGSNAAPQTCSLMTSVPVPPIADLGVSLSAPSQVSGGDIFKFSVVVTNAGPQAAKSATTDVFIGSSTIINSGGCTPVPNQPNHFTCPLGDLPAGGSKPLDFMVRAPACVGCVAGNPIDFTVDAKSQTCDPTLPNHAMKTVQVTCPPINNLTITKTGSPDPVVPGQAVIYDITVKNTGASAVSGAVVEDDFPPELKGVLWCRGAGCTPSLPPPLKEPVDLAGGETKVYRLSGTVQPMMCSGVLHNKATITPPASVCDDPSDNQALADTQVVANGVHAFCEGISGPMMELTPITKTLLLINCGPADQADNPGDEFTDVLPAGLTLTGVSATSGMASSMGNTAKWNGAIPVGGTVTITITANINAGTAGTTLCNQATIAYDADGDGINESIGFSDDPDEPGPADPCCFRVLLSTEIPALSGDGLAALALLLAGLAVLRLRRRSL